MNGSANLPVVKPPLNDDDGGERAAMRSWRGRKFWNFDLRQETRGRWYEILTHFGIPASYLTGKPGPCPICRAGKDRFRWDNKNSSSTIGNGGYFCRHCGAGSGLDLLMGFYGWDAKQAIREVRNFISPRKSAPVAGYAGTAVTSMAVVTSGAHATHTTAEIKLQEDLENRKLLYDSCVRWLRQVCRRRLLQGEIDDTRVAGVMMSHFHMSMSVAHYMQYGELRAHPSIVTLVRDSGMSRRQVEVALAQLEKHGDIKIIPRFKADRLDKAGRPIRSSNLYIAMIRNRQ
jgi:hypothetical protein